MDGITFFLLLFAALIIMVDIVAVLWFGGMLIPLIAGGGPYVPSQPHIVDDMIHLADLSETDVVADLGSGDGRILIAAAKAGAGKIIGYEVHPGLVKLARNKARKAGVADRINIHKTSMWKADLTGVTVVFLYQIPYAMKKLRDKLEHELPTGARIVSNAFEIPDRKPVQQDDRARLYRI